MRDSQASVAMNLAVLSHHIGPGECEQILQPELQPIAMRTGGLEGIILIHRWPAEVVEALARKAPVVSIIHDYPGLAIDHVGIDDRSGLWSLVRHLTASLHLRIGFYGFCPEVSWSRSRMAAFVEALATEGLEFDPAQIVKVGANSVLSDSEFVPEGDEVAQIAACEKLGVTAWIASCSAAGWSLLRYFLQQGRRIPQDVAVASCHQKIQPGHDLPDITSYRVPDEDLGAAALRRLVHRLEHGGERMGSILLPPDFYQGTTTSRHDPAKLLS